MVNNFKFSVIASFAIFGMMVASCSSEDEVVPEIKPTKTVEKTDTAAETPAKNNSEAKSMPELQSIESLSAEATHAEGTFKTNGSLVQPGSEGAIVIQVSIQPSKSAANAILKKLEEKGIKGYLAQVENPGELEGTYYRVRVGYFKKLEDAKAYGKSALEPLEFAWWIDNKANDSVGTPESTNAASNPSNTGYSSPEPMEIVSSSSTEAESSSSEVVAPSSNAQAASTTAESLSASEAVEPAPAKPAEEVYDDWE